MLKDLALVVLIVNALVLVLIGMPMAAVLHLLFAFWIHKTRFRYSHVLGKELNFVGARLAQKMPALFALALLITLLGDLTFNESTKLYTSLALAGLPILLILAFSKRLAASSKELDQFRAIRIIRSVFALNFALVILVFTGLFGLIWYQILPAINVQQILALQLLLLLPIAALQNDKSHHKLIKVNDRNLRNHTINKHSLKQYAGFGLIMTLVLYVNYLMMFTRHGLSPDHLDNTLPLYIQATTLTLATILFCMFAHIIFERVEKHEFFINHHTLENRKLLQAFGMSITVFATLIYTPKLREVFQLVPLDAWDWLCAMLAALVYVGFRILNRHTRKYTRKAVVKLHKELNFLD